LSAELSVIGQVDPEPLAIPEAGASWDLWITLEFLGQSAVAGIIGGLALESLKATSAALRRFAAKRMESGRGIEVHWVRIVCADRAIMFADARFHESPDVYFVRDAVLEHLSELASEVAKHLETGPLKVTGTQIIVPTHVSDTGQPSLSRYWWIAERNASPTYSYDSRDRRIRVVSEDFVPSVWRGQTKVT
jgi:hypothetical protein